jgi:hypothetical protein
MAAAGTVMAFAPFVDWGRFLPDPSGSVSERVKAQIDQKILNLRYGSDVRGNGQEMELEISRKSLVRGSYKSKAALDNGKAASGSFSFSANGYTSTYLLYADGLDSTKPIGLLIYADGSGEYGLKHPTSSYLLAGDDGLISVARRHNMVLLTPLSPNKNCADGSGSCWYMGDPPGYTRWLESLVRKIQSQYAIDKRRIAFGGYSSGAQLATEWWIPSGAAQRTMTSGVIVAISYGGSPKMPEVAYAPSFKSSVHMNWNVGSKDPSYIRDGKYSVKAGYDHYTRAGFKTSLDIVRGLSHDRDGTFGSVMDTQITKHVPPQ